MAQLVNLRQGKKALTEYIATFNQLALCAKVTNDVNKCNYFIQGLPEDSVAAARLIISRLQLLPAMSYFGLAAAAREAKPSANLPILKPLACITVSTTRHNQTVN